MFQDFEMPSSLLFEKNRRWLFQTNNEERKYTRIPHLGTSNQDLKLKCSKPFSRCSSTLKKLRLISLSN